MLVKLPAAPLVRDAPITLSTVKSETLEQKMTKAKRGIWNIDTGLYASEIILLVASTTVNPRCHE